MFSVIRSAISFCFDPKVFIDSEYQMQENESYTQPNCTIITGYLDVKEAKLLLLIYIHNSQTHLAKKRERFC